MKHFLTGILFCVLALGGFAQDEYVDSLKREVATSNDIGKKIALLVIGIETLGLKDDTFASILDVYVKISKLAKEDETIEQKSFD